MTKQASVPGNGIRCVRTRRVPNEKGYGHAGQHAALMKSEDGYRAWGFGDTPEQAEQDGIASVRSRQNQQPS